jgi:hypothetical protein
MSESIFQGGTESLAGKKKKKKKILAYLEDTVPTKLNFSLAKGQGILKSENAGLPIRFGGYHV